MELYKYCKTEDMEALFEKNTLMLGTLFNWRGTGKYGEMAMDQSEGHMKTTGNVIFYDYRFLREIMVEGTVEEVDGGRRFENKFMYTTDVYAFCTAASYSHDAHVRWLNCEGYASCYKILTARLFFRAISGVLNDCNFVVYDRIHYYDPTLPNQTFMGTFHPALLKHNDFGSQDEVRAIWKPKDKNAQISPMCITVPHISKYCERYRTIGSSPT